MRLGYAHGSSDVYGGAIYHSNRQYEQTEDPSSILTIWKMRELEESSLWPAVRLLKFMDVYNTESVLHRHNL